MQDGKSYHYIEPFCGSASIALYLLDSANPPKSVVLNDINEDLINLYKVVQSQPIELLNYLKTIQKEYNQLEDRQSKYPYYYAKQARFNTRNADSIEHAGLFIFLNRAGFNGLYRVNSKYEFNVPISSYKKPNFVFEDEIKKASELLTDVTLLRTASKT